MLSHRPVYDLIIGVVQHGECRVVLELDVCEAGQDQSEQLLTAIRYLYRHQAASLTIQGILGGGIHKR